MAGAAPGGLALMSCVRETSLEPPYDAPQPDRNGADTTRKGRFLRGLRRMFRRRGPAEERAASATSATAAELKSRSTGELLRDGHHDRTHIHKEGSSGSSGGCEGAYASGLSVSHDSVFTGERSGASGTSGTSGGDSGDERTQRPRRHHHHHHLTTGVRAELFDAVRRRGRDTSDDDEDLGLPRSPPASPPVKHHQRHHAGISQSSCSDGSLLSVGSSEPDDDSSGVQLESYVVSEPPSGVAPLSHAAARHKMAVRPRRTHGAPRRNRSNVTVAAVGVSVGSLPITPELNEECAGGGGVVAASRQLITETFSTKTVRQVTTSKDAQTQLTNELTQMLECAENKARIKSASLPPGLQLSQLSAAPAKLTIAHHRDNSTQSSIKRSKSSTQGKSSELAQTEKMSSQYIESPKYHSEQRASHNKYAYISNSNEVKSSYRRETLERDENKMKLDKKEEDKTKAQESESKNSAKREESFFTRLLLRKSGKKAKKEIFLEPENQSEKKTIQNKLPTSHYKSLNVESQSKTTFAEHAYVRQQKMMCYDQNAHSAGQRAFANQAHKRIDNKGVYVNETLLKENVSNFSKDSVMDYGTNDLKYVTETDKTGDVINKCLNKDNDAYKRSNIDVVRVREQVDNRKSQDWTQKSVSNTTTHTIFTETAKEKNVQNLKLSDEYMFTPTPSPRCKTASQQEFAYNGGSMPKVIPYSSKELQISYSASPPRSIWPHMESNIQHRSSSLAFPIIPERTIYRTEQEPVKSASNELNISKSSSELDTDSNFYATDMVMGEARNLIGKSHSFRFPSESLSHSEENQMPSLPAIVGISEPLMESWEVNYRKNLGTDSDRFINPGNNDSKRLSARNYDVFTPGMNENFSSLPSTESSFLDSLKADQEKTERKSIYINSSNEPKSEDISQIEAKIDDIIGSPKILISPVLKSSSLDSVKSYPDKHVIEERRKTISTDNILSSNVHVTANTVGSVSFHTNQPEPEFKSQSRSSDGFENHVTVTHIKRETLPEEKVVYENLETLKIISRSVEKLSDKFDPTVPEFLKIQLNKVDSKPKINVVLTANASPRRSESANVNIRSCKDIMDETYAVEKSSNLLDENSSPTVTVLEINKMSIRNSDEGSDTRERVSMNNVHLRKTGSQQLLNRSMEQLSQDTFSNVDNLPKIFPEKVANGKLTPIDVKKSATNATNNYTLPPLSPIAYKPFYKKKAISIEINDSKTDSLKSVSTGIETQNERVYENVTIEQKTYSSFGSRTSLQSYDSNEMKTPERSDETVVFRKKPVVVAKEQKPGCKKDDEPELMKVFARRSLKLKDSEAETLAQEIMEANATKEEIMDDLSSNKCRLMKNELNSSIKSRDSDKENDSGSPKEDTNRRRTFDNDYNQIIKNKNLGNLKMNEVNEKQDSQRTSKKFIDSSSVNNNGVNPNLMRGINFAPPYYQRSVSVTSVSNNNINGEKVKTVNKNEVNKYKKEVSDSTPEKRLRNRTFPDSSNDREEIKTIGVKNAAISFKNDSASLPKKPWSQFKQDDNGNKRGYKNASFGFLESQKVMDLSPDAEKMVSDAVEQESSDVATSDRDTDASPQFKGMLHMRAEWERRTKQAITK